MANEAEKVKSGYAELKYNFEREDVKKFIKEFDEAGTTTRINLTENLKDIRNKSLGPTADNNCPCCGK